MIDIKSDLDEEDVSEYKTIKQILKGPPRRRTTLSQSSLLPPDLQRRPSSTGTGEIDELKFKDPLTQKDKTRIRDLQKDYAIVSSVNVLIHYVLGRNVKATLYPVVREQLNSQEEVTDALNVVLQEFALPPNSFDKFQTFIDQVDLSCELDYYLRKAMAQAYFYDQSALWIVKANDEIMTKSRLVNWGFREGVPTGFRPLDSFSLGQITVNTKSWEPTFIEYHGNLGGIDDVSRSRKTVEELDMDELVYFTRNDYNIKEDSYNYGGLGLLSICELSETLRRLNKKVFPEVSNNQWAGTHIIQMEGTSEKEVITMTNSIKPARTKITNQPIQVHNLTPNVQMNSLIDLRSSTILNELLKIGVPSFVMNFEDIPNVATALTVAFIWQETKLEDERNWLRSTLWRQWYRKLMQFYFDQDEQEFLDLRVKVVTEFKSIEFASIFEKAIAVTNLRNAGVLSPRESREMINLPPFPPDFDSELDEASQLLAENPDLIPVLKQLAQNQVQQDQKQQGIETGNGKDQTAVPATANARSPEAVLSQIKRKVRKAGTVQ